MRQVEARTLMAGQEVLFDPLDVRTGLVLAEVERSQFTSTTKLWMVRGGDILVVVVPNDRLVMVL